MFLAMALGSTLLGCPKKTSELLSDAGATASVDASAPPHAAASASAPPLLDVCGLIPAAKLATATGVPVTVGDAPIGAATPKCVYKTKADAKLPRLIVEKSLSTIAGAKHLWPGGKDVTGIGDAAYLAPRATELDVQKGSTVIRVGYEPEKADLSEDARAAVLKKLAEAVLPDLAK